MIKTSITVNGKQYKSLEEMPPDVRQQYDEAMRRMAAALSGGQESAQANSVIRNIVTVSNRTFGNNPAEMPLPIEPSRMPSEGRRFVYDLAFWVIVGLALWFWLGRY